MTNQEEDSYINYSLLGALTSYFVHDLSSPLSLVKGKLQKIEMSTQDSAELKGELAKDLIKISLATDRMILMLRQLRVLTYQESLMELQEIDLAECVTMSQRFIESKFVHSESPNFVNKFDTVAPSWGYRTEIVYLLTVALEAMTNVVKDQVGKDQVRKEIRTQVKQENEFVIVEVEVEVEVEADGRTLDLTKNKFFSSTSQSPYALKILEQHQEQCVRNIVNCGGDFQTFSNSGRCGLRLKLPRKNR